MVTPPIVGRLYLVENRILLHEPPNLTALQDVTASFDGFLVASEMNVKI